LQNLADERPLLLAEIGLDSRRNGETAQAESIDWQTRTVFTEGATGTFVFAWTDEWFRGGHDIDDWDFGLVTRDRQPKAALASVRRVFSEVPFALDTKWPRMSVVVCSYNGARTIRDTLEGLKAVEYPDYEVIVVNDGSTDATPDIAGEYDVKLISTENRGLSNARNTGWQAATGEIVAYIDDDAYPDPHWLKYLAWTFLHSDFVGVGGPNIAPPGDGPIAECVYNAPGGPVQVLLTDRVAEHIPGCNMAFRREALAAIDGFDARYRAAGDDVDLCWRLQDAGGRIGFHAAAIAWHHRRNSVTMFWRQQKGYGKAEALLEEKWPERYNPIGHLTWSGRLYGRGWTLPALAGRWHVYHGTWGQAPFQSLYQSEGNSWLSLPLMPEWYLVIGLLAVLSLVGLTWAPLLVAALPLLLIAVALPVMQAVRSAAKSTFSSKPKGLELLHLKAITAFLHLMQPLARLIGRIEHGLVPWRRRGTGSGSIRLFGANPTLWFEQWQDPSALLKRLSDELKRGGVPCRAGGDYDDWDLEIRGGLLGFARLNMTVEEHGGGKQLFRFRVRPRLACWGLWLAGLFGAIAVLAVRDAAWFAGSAAAVLTLTLVGTALRDSGWASADAQRAVKLLESPSPTQTT
jgi:GT2 family glycosyltransferase